MCVSICAPCVRKVPALARRGSSIPRTGITGLVSCLMWVLGTEQQVLFTFEPSLMPLDDSCFLNMCESFTCSFV